MSPLRFRPLDRVAFLGLPWLAAGAACLAGAAPARAQLDPSVSREPWTKKPHWADTNDYITFIFGGHSKQTGEDLDIFYWPSYGRFKLKRKNTDPTLGFGYNFLTMSISGDGTGDLPKDYFDLGLVGSSDLGPIGGGWDLSVTAGAGSANDNHWSNTDAIYGVGVLEATHPLDENTDLRVGLDYHGNRNLLPDVPLPYAAISRRVSDQLRYTVGLPKTSLTWKPFHPVTLEMGYDFPVDFLSQIRYDFTEHVGLFALYKHQVSAFHLDEQQDRRLFYNLDQVTAGVRLTWEPWINADLGVGYAFNQDLSRGFDIRNTASQVTPSDHLLFSITMRGTF